MMNDMHSHLLPIQGACNVRDIGNYETQDGRRTKEGIFFRSDNTAGYTEKDVQFFIDRGLTLAVDLRSADETGRQASAFAHVPGIHYENIQLIDGIHSQFTKDNIPSTMGQLYIQFLETGKAQFGKMFRLFAANTGASLYHCTAGKDRTGVTTMLLLSLAGVCDSTIIEDYAATEVFTAHIIESQKTQLAAIGLAVPDFMLHADPQNMEEVLTHLHKAYGSAEDYLNSCGVTAAEMAAIKNRFLITSK